MTDTATPAPFVELRGLRKHFGSAPALRDVTLDVGPDELLVVLGPTGAGKTTLLRTLAGLETPDAGDVRLGGQSVLAASPAERDVALVFQNFSLYPDWTVRRNLAFPLRAPGRRLAADEIDRRVAWAADLLQITALLDRPAQRLSGGQMQRVAIGRALVRRPRLFLLDEPLTNLDAKLREALRVELVELRRRLRTPMIYVTHDQAEALSMADRIAVLVEGAVRQVGSPAEVYDRPASPTVARLLGQPAINLLAVQRSEGWWRTAGGAAVLPADAGGPDRRTLGIRPEAVTLGPAPAGGPVPPATVRVVQDFGPVLVVLADWADVAVHAVVPKPAAVTAGQTVGVTLDRGRAILWE